MSLSDHIRRVAQQRHLTERPRAGEDGGCLACSQSIASHVGTHGEFLGCIAGDGETVFMLIPVKQPSLVSDGRVGAAPVIPQDAASVQAKQPMRRFRRARYFVTPTHPDHLTAQRSKVYTALARFGSKGATAAQLIESSHLPHGNVQQVLAWLRQRNYITAVDADGE